jgi:hypothetical protein
MDNTEVPSKELIQPNMLWKHFKAVSPGIKKPALMSSPVTKELYRKPTQIGNSVNNIEVPLGGIKPSWDW